MKYNQNQFVHFFILDPLATSDAKKKFLVLSLVGHALQADNTSAPHVLSPTVVGLLMRHAGSKDTLQPVAKQTVSISFSKYLHVFYGKCYGIYSEKSFQNKSIFSL